MDSILTSVVIPLYNKARYIERAIRSVLKQSHGNLEVLVVDDCSQDGGDKIAERIKDARVKLIRRQKNGGQSAARNTGIMHSGGENVAFLDADDEWLPDHLLHIVELEAKFPQAGFFFTAYRVILPRALTQEVQLTGIEHLSYQWSVSNYFAVNKRKQYAWISAVAIPRQVLDAVGNFLEGEQIGGDIELTGRIALRYRVAYDRRVSAVYHAEAQGRENPRKDRKLQEPPFVRTYREICRQGTVTYQPSHHIEDYVNLLWLNYIGLVIRCGSRREFKRVLAQEIAYTGCHKRDLSAWKWLATCLPTNVLALAWRFRYSRYWPLRKG